MSKETAGRLRRNLTLLLLLAGVILGGLSLSAELFGLDLTPGFGMVQMFQLLLGLSCLTLAAFIHLRGRRRLNAPRSLQADIGVRLAATGLVFAFVSGLSDLIGIGTHVTPSFDRPFVGPLQLGGIGVGILSIAAGIFLYYSSRGSRDQSSMEFLVNGKSVEELEDDGSDQASAIQSTRTVDLGQ